MQRLLDQHREEIEEEKRHDSYEQPNEHSVPSERTRTDDSMRNMFSDIFNHDDGHLTLY